METRDIKPVLRIGTRASPLALAQAEHVRAQMLATPAFSGYDINLVPITTRGDKILDKPLAEIGGKGLFTAELDQGLLEGTLDLAVHSLKDLPTDSSDLFAIAATPRREDARDCFISPTNYQNSTTLIAYIPQGATIGTASLRRGAQLLARRPDLKIVSIRGNVGTRLQKMIDQKLAGIILARAGLNRLGYDDDIGISMDPDLMLPAAGQGALAIQCHARNHDLIEKLSVLHDPTTHACVAAERQFLNRLEGNCRTPIAAFATIHHNTLTLKGRVLSLDGQRHHDVSGSVPMVAAVSLADRLADDVIQNASDILPPGNGSRSEPQKDH